MAYKSINQITLTVTVDNAKADYAVPIGTGTNTAKMSLIQFVNYASKMLNLDERIDEKANASDVYTKDESDVTTENIQNQIDNINQSVEGVYTKTEVDTKLNEKANADDVYTKAEVDTITRDLQDGIDSKVDQNDYDQNMQSISDNFDTLSDAIDTKANSIDVYDKSQVDAKDRAIQDDVNTKASQDDFTALQNDVYTKSQVDDTIQTIQDEVDTKAPQETTYSKDEVDSLLNDKADNGDGVTQEYVDGELDKKANKTDVYTKAELYTKDDLYTIEQSDELFITWDALTGNLYTKMYTEVLDADVSSVTFSIEGVYILNNETNDYSVKVYRNGLLQPLAELDIPFQDLSNLETDLSSADIVITYTDDLSFNVGEVITLECLVLNILDPNN